MTSVRAAGYSSRGRPAGQISFDPFNQAGIFLLTKLAALQTNSKSSPKTSLRPLSEKSMFLLKSRLLQHLKAISNKL